MARKKNKDKEESKAPPAATAAPEKMKRKTFEQELEKLQVELTRLQAWVKAEGRGSSWSSRAATRPARAA